MSLQKSTCTVGMEQHAHLLPFASLNIGIKSAGLCGFEGRETKYANAMQIRVP